VKIAVGYYVHCGGSAEHIRETINTVVTDALPPVSRVGMLYAFDPIPARGSGVVTHVIALNARDDGRLQAYVELFNLRNTFATSGDAFRAQDLPSHGGNGGSRGRVRHASHPAHRPGKPSSCRNNYANVLTLYADPDPSGSDRAELSRAPKPFVDACGVR
jgi:hypothetical protein